MLKYLILFILLLVGLSASAQLDTVALRGGQKFFIRSKSMGEQVEAWIRLPDDFAKVKDSCAVLVLLDGDEYFKIAADIAGNYEWAKRMPATVIIGLPSTGSSRWKYFTPSNARRPGSKDSLLYKNSGHFPEFADFLEQEMLPAVERHYGVKFGSKAIFGHSNGGMAVLSFYILRPTIFDRYIAASPALLWDNYYLQKQLTAQPRTAPLYMTLGTGGWDYDPRSFRIIKGKLRQTNPRFQLVRYKNERHATSGLRSLLDGIEFVYRKPKK